MATAVAGAAEPEDGEGLAVVVVVGVDAFAGCADEPGHADEGFADTGVN